MNIKNIVTCAAMAAVVSAGLTACADGTSGCVMAAGTKDGSWENPPGVTDDSFAIRVDDVKRPSVINPNEDRTNEVLVTECALRFDGATTEDMLPDTAIGGVFLVVDSAGVFRFACRIDSELTTNNVLVAEQDKDYVLHTTFDKKLQTVTYRIKSGDEPYKLIHSGKFCRRTNGKVGFTGNGKVQEVRWEDK